jgi:hydrophobic/amphiphilic exporter-1 (mainly G- bacteria), HAE1 family
MIADTFIKRPVTSIVISLVITIIGILAILNLPVSKYPEITPPIVQVSATYTGADAQTIEQTVATPIEAQVNGVPGMDFIQTNCSDGQMSMTITFNLGTNIDIATLDVQNRVSIASPQLPDDVKRLGVTVRKRNTTSLMNVALYSPKGTHNAQYLDNYTNIYVREALLRVDGVGEVSPRGDDFSMRLWISPEKLSKLGITANEVINAVQEQNIQVAAGSVGKSPQIKEQSFEYTLFVNGRLSKVEEFGNIIVKSKPESGSLVRLKDVGRVELGKFNYSGGSFVDGYRSSYLLVYQTPGSNAIETAEGVYKAMEKLSKSFPPDVKYVVPFESVSVVQVSIHEVLITLLIALILVVLVVYLFLQNWRATLIPMLAIPVSIIGSFVFFLPLGFTINTLTLFGVILAIGIVVDDAIIVVEAVQHYIDNEHLSAKEATVKAMSDISGPVVAIALVLASVFVPVGFIPGIVGRLYQQFAVTIAISVLISAFIALTLTPVLCSLILKPSKIVETSKGLNRFFYLFNNWFNRTSVTYSHRVLKNIKNFRYVLVIMLLIIIATAGLFKFKPTGFIPLEDEGRLTINIELPDASSMTRTVQVLHKTMDLIKDIPGISHYSGLAGINIINGSQKSNNATIFCQLKPWDERKGKDLQIAGIISEMQKRFAVIKEANIVVISPPAIPGLGSTGGFSFILQQRESTDDTKAFERVVKNFLVEAGKRPEIGKVFSFFTAHTPAYQLTVDREKCKKLGVSLTDVFSTIQTFMGSRYINDFTIYGRNFRVLAQADTLYRSDIKTLGEYFVRNQQGNMLPLSTLVTVNVIESAPLITHFNLYRSSEVNGDAKAGYSSGQAIQALQEVADKTLPSGYNYEFSGLSRQEIKAGSTTIYIFALCLLFVFLFLAALYESWSTPFSVLLAVPFGAFGAMLFLTFNPGLSNNIYAQIGLITLIGLAAKNSILIVEFAKIRVDNGMNIINATMQAVRLRLRPILMTSLAFVSGVLPLAFASGAGAVARRTIGWTVIGGMLSATFLGIFIVPVLFVLITRIAGKKKNIEELESSN